MSEERKVLHVPKMGGTQTIGVTKAREIASNIEDLTDAELEAELQRRVDEPASPLAVQPQAAGALDKVIRDIDLKFTEADQDLPERVREAQAFLRIAKERGYWDRKISPLMTAAIQEALKIGAEYNATR